jgi:hypothetical protein
MEKNLEKHVFSSHGNNHNAINHDIQNNDKQQQHQHHEVHNQLLLSKYYNVSIRFDPITPEARKPTELMLSVTDQKLGDPIREFELVHDKLMHVIIVAEDLSYFTHIHPTIRDGNDGDTTISHTFPESGKYKLWVDFKPKGETKLLQHLNLMLPGSLFMSLKNLYMIGSIPSDLWMANIKLA